MLFFPLWKRFMVWSIIVCGVFIALPNILPHSVLTYLPKKYASLHLPMGIDLQGGSRLVVGFDSKQDAIEHRDLTIDIIRRRLAMSAQYFSSYYISKQGTSQIRVEVPGLFDTQFLKDIIITPAFLAIYAEETSITSQDIIYTMEDPPVGYLVKKPALLTNNDIAHTDLGEKTAGGFVNVAISLTPQGIEKLATSIKAKNLQRYIASFDGEVLAIFKLSSENLNGVIQLGSFAQDVAENLLLVFSAGALPADVTLIEERTIGADMGDDYAKTGLYAAFGAIIIVMLFMVLCYGTLGVIADIALAVNLVLLIAVLSLIGTSLSLSGFAGLVLIIGISVDANILIYERIREDRRNGFSITQSIQSGFTCALGTIIDANVTTLIAAVVLFFLGIGPIHGFALTVTVGIITSLFTTITLTRMMIVGWLKFFKPLELPYQLVRLVPVNTNIGFMKIRFITIGFSAVLVFLTFVLYGVVGINYGVDFSGGSLAVLQAKQGNADIQNIRDRIWNINIYGASVDASQNKSKAFVTIANQNLGENAEQTVARKLDAEFGNDYTLQRMDVVGPTVSQELSRASRIAIIVSLLSILFYVWFRFRWQFAVGAVLATIHDIIILVGIFIFFQWQFNIWSIAALLAIIGYSLNDTIVVYDRVRDLLRRKGQISIAALVDLAINKTLSRTILTSLATLIAHIPLYYFGGPEMRNFASILLLGIVIGTYSSIFIAGPLLVFFGVKPSDRQLEIAVEGEGIKYDVRYRNA